MAKPPAPEPVKRATTKKVPFAVRLTGARKVALAGDFNRWAKEGIALKNASSEKWETVLDLPPGRYEYRLVVDGEWRDDPDAKLRVRNTFGTENCVLTVS